MIRDKLLMGVQKEDGFTYLYASGTAAFRVKKYYVDTLEQTDDVSAHLQFSNLTSMCHGNGALYVGRTTFKHVVKLDLHTLAGDDPLVVSPGYGGDVHAVCCFGDYVYAGGSSDSTSHSRVKRYNASDLTLEDPAVESANFGQPIRRLIPHGGYIYGGSGGLAPRIRRYNPNLTLDTSSPTFSNNISNFAIHGDYVYVIGGTGRVFRLNLDDLSFDDPIVQSPEYGGTLDAIAIKGNYLYAAGLGTQRIRRYNLSDLSEDDPVVQSPMYGGNIHRLVINGDYIYAGGSHTQRIRRYNLSDLTADDPIVQSDDYGGTIFEMFGL